MERRKPLRTPGNRADNTLHAHARDVSQLLPYAVSDRTPWI
jgi:hypothetical protein